VVNYSQWGEALRGGLVELVRKLVEYLPGLLGALALLLGGWILARLLRRLIVSLASRFGWLLESRFTGRAMKRLGVERRASEVVGSIVFWAVLLVFIMAATETLGVPVIATWIGGLSYYLPRMIAGLLILFAGLLAGNLAGEAIRRAAQAAGFAQAALLGQAARLAILLIAVVTAVEQLGIDTAFLTATIAILFGAIVGGAALAFGLGARAHVGNLIAAHYLRQVYREGQTVRVAEVEGRLAEIIPTAAVIETDEGRVLVPAGEFSENVSVLVTPGS
jgi:hypothetical protein